jgi:hypothetical protein
MGRTTLHKKHESHQPEPARAQPFPWLALTVLAGALTLLNALKPIHVDDTAYYKFAQQIADHPLDPYGFTMLWYQQPEPANQILAPPVVPYWLALGMKVVGNAPFSLKLWMFPFAWLLAVFLHGILVRFESRDPLWLTAMLLFSPVVLPGFNLMLDVPALALSVTALAVFIVGCERGSSRLALLAGIIAGLAMQTKYTAVTVPAALVIYGAFSARWRFSALAAVASTILFAAWEIFTWRRYGESHLLCNVRQKHTLSITPLSLAWPLVTMTGALSPFSSMLNLAALGARARAVAAIGFLAGLSVLLVAEAPPSWVQPDKLEWLYGVWGFLAIASFAVIVYRVWPWQQTNHKRDQAAAFLLWWLLLEIVAYFCLSPFPAARRLPGIMVVTTILCGHAAGLAAWDTARVKVFRAIALAEIALGLLYFVVDYREARAQMEAIDRAVSSVRSEDRYAPIWYVGHWGFQFYAEKAGLKPIVPGSSVLRAGDWIVLPDRHIYQQNILPNATTCTNVAVIGVQDRWPLRTLVGYYMGGLPLQRLDGPRLTINLVKVTQDFKPLPPR